MAPRGIVCTEKDVLLSRGKRAIEWPGNADYKRLISENREDYALTNRNSKSKVAQRVMDAIKEKGGRFLRDVGGQWEALDDERALEKTCQALRERLTTDEAKQEAEDMEITDATPKRRASRRVTSRSTPAAAAVVKKVNRSAKGKKQAVKETKSMKKPAKKITRASKKKGKAAPVKPVDEDETEDENEVNDDDDNDDDEDAVEASDEDATVVSEEASAKSGKNDDEEMEDDDEEEADPDAEVDDDDDDDVDATSTEDEKPKSKPAAKRKRSQVVSPDAASSNPPKKRAKKVEKEEIDPNSPVFYKIEENDMLYRLAVFQRKHGHAAVPPYYPEDVRLSEWCSAQRQLARMAVAFQDAGRAEVQRLQNLEKDFDEFCWDYDEWHWNRHFNALLSTLNKDTTSKNSNITVDDIEDWIDSQKDLHKIGRVTKQRVELLQKVGCYL